MGCGSLEIVPAVIEDIIEVLVVVDNFMVVGVCFSNCLVSAEVMREVLETELASVDSFKAIVTGFSRSRSSNFLA